MSRLDSLKDINRVSLLLAGAVALATLALSSAGYLSQKLQMIMLGGIVLLIVMGFATAEKRLISMPEAATKARVYIKRLQREGLIEAGKIEALTEQTLVEVDGEPKKYDILVSSTKAGNIMKYVVSVNCFNGDIKKVTKTTDWKAGESPDLKVVVMNDLYDALKKKAEVKEKYGVEV